MAPAAAFKELPRLNAWYITSQSERITMLDQRPPVVVYAQVAKPPILPESFVALGISYWWAVVVFRVVMSIVEVVQPDASRTANNAMVKRLSVESPL